MAGRSPLGTAGLRPDDLMITASDAEILRETYKKLQPHLSHHALIMFLTIFDVSEEMRDLFWFVRDMDEPAPTNPVLQRHANTAFKLICDSCCQLDDRAAVAGMLPAMQALGGRHIKYNVRRQHMAVFRMAFLKTVGKALGSGWTEEVEGAWSRAYGKVEEMVTAGLGGR